MKVKCSHCISIVVFALIVTTLIIVVCHNWWDNPRLLNETLSKYGPRAPHRIPTAMELTADFGHLASTVTSNVLPRRLLFMTASYTFAQFHSLQKTLDCMRDICNAGWDVTVLLQTANGFNSSHPIYTEVVDRAFCLRTMASIPIVVEQFGQIGFGLNVQHRVYMRGRLDDFDYFSYGEEDMQLTLSHLTAYISAEQTLRAAMSREQWLRYFPGFLRFEDSLVGAERVTWEYMPHQVHTTTAAATVATATATAASTTVTVTVTAIVTVIVAAAALCACLH